MNITTIHDAYKWASSFLKKRNLELPVAEWLLRHYLQIDRTTFFLSLHDPFPQEYVTQLREDLQAHATGVPVQHLIGYDYFFGRRFKVNRHVLIPRPETEELVVALQKVKRKLFPDTKVSLVDVGTGSGVIAITFALEEEATVIATDISEDALHVAKENGRTFGANIEWIQGDLLTPLIDQQRTVDFVVSNPPYISLRDKETLAVHVKDYEPHLALFGGDDGLHVYRTCMAQLPYVMNEKGCVAFEVGIGQAKTVKHWLQSIFPKANTKIINDINGKERIVIAYGNMTT